MERAIAIELKHFEADHPTLATSYCNLGMILKDLGDLSGAKAQMERAIAIEEKHFDPDHPALGVRYGNMGWILKDMGELGEARRLIEKAGSIFAKHFGPEHPYRRETERRLGEIKRLEGRV
jgi:tetratricopeptide (TPR) repeat protein